MRDDDDGYCCAQLLVSCVRFPDFAGTTKQFSHHCPCIASLAAVKIDLGAGLAGIRPDQIRLCIRI